MMILVLGGSGSGKSAYAEDCMLSFTDAANRYYLATMQVYGEEDRRKVERHRSLRKGKGFLTIEQPRFPSNALKQIKEPEHSAVLLECISNLTANEMFSDGSPFSAAEIKQRVIAEIAVLKKELKHLIVVSGNVFEDGILYDESTMKYLRAMGTINQELAQMADEVVELVVGIPVVLKERRKA